MSRNEKISQLYIEYCEWMESIDAAREQMANSFKTLNEISDDDWNLLIAYADQQI